MNWIEKVLTLFKKAEAPQHPEEAEVPRHRWVSRHDAVSYMGSNVEIHEDSNVFGQTMVSGRVTAVEYDSSDDRTTLTLQGPNFIATVDLYNGDKFIVHL
jgi:hypothetical protein